MEFEYINKQFQGLIYGAGADKIANNALADFGTNDLSCIKGCFTKMKKIGHIDGISESTADYKAKEAIKAYFEQSKPEQQYKVGELVEVVGVTHARNTSCGLKDSFIGEVFRVHHMESAGIVRLSGSDKLDKDNRVPDGSYWAMKISDIRPLSGTYQQRQAKAVEFYGWKVGDEVKVVRKCKAREDGYGGDAWNCSDNKTEMQGGQFAIDRISSCSVNVTNPSKGQAWQFPYFALEPVK